MNFEIFTQEFGVLIKNARKIHSLSLQNLALKTGIVYDQIQKIESAKHGGIQIETYTKLLNGLNVGLSFTKTNTDNIKIIPISNEMIEFINQMFLGLPSDSNYQFLNFNHTLLTKYIGEIIIRNRKLLKISQKEFAKYVDISLYSSTRFTPSLPLF